jgi:hypothetical protein
MLNIDLSKNSHQTWLALATGSAGLLIGLMWLANSLSFPRPTRFIPLIGSGIFSLGGAIAYSRGIKPAQKWQVDEVADITLFEIERENAMQDLDEEDDARRELDRYARKVAIETEAMQKTLPMQLQLQQMRSILYPSIQHPAGSPAPENAPPIAQYPGMPTPMQVSGSAPIAPNEFAFDFSELRNIDNYPVISVIGGMGAGKSKLLKWLSKSVFCSQEVRACDAFGRKSEWQSATIYPTPAAIYQLMVDDLAAIEKESEEYREGRSDYPERLTVLEESPDTLAELRDYQREKQQETPKPQRRDAVGRWLMKSLTFNRKLRRRAAFVSVSMSATEFIPAEHRNKAVVLFPGSAIGLAMGDVHYFKLGTSQNAKLRDQLNQHISGLKNPCLVYRNNRWFAGSLPDLDLEGNVIGTQNPVTPPAAGQVEQLESLLDLDFPEDEDDR